MWIDDGRLRTIQEPHTDAAAVDRLLAEALDDRTHPHDAPERCPLCQQPLVVRTLDHHAIRMCPSENGAWLTADDITRMRTLAAHAEAAVRRRRAAFALLVVAAGALFVVRRQVEEAIAPYFFPPAVHQPAPVFDRAAGAPGSFVAVPINASAIDAHDELAYVVDALRLLDDGIENRLAIDTAFRQAGDATAAFATFEPKQREFLVQLRALTVPGRLAVFHQHLVVATEHQIELYRAFAARKAADGSADLKTMLRHPALVTTNRELISAYTVFKTLYPDLDTQTHDAVYGRLCALDVI